MKTLYLIRHSLTTGNERRWYYGAADLPLSESGRALCQAMKGAYSLDVDVAFATSGMLRAEETLKLLFGDVPREQFPDLREMNMGKFEMHTYDELKDDPDFQRWCEDDAFVIPGGESNQGYAHRVERGIRQILSEHEVDEKSLLLVCHGGTIRRAMTFLFAESGKSFWDWQADSCHGYAVHFEESRASSYEVI